MKKLVLLIAAQKLDEMNNLLFIISNIFFTRFLVVCIGDRILALSQAKESAALGSMDGARVQTVQILARPLNHFVATLYQSHRKLIQTLDAVCFNTDQERQNKEKDSVLFSCLYLEVLW